MGLDQTLHPASQVRHPQGRPAADRRADGGQRAEVRAPRRLPRADGARGVWALADGASLLPHMATRWSPAKNSRRPSPESPAARWPHARPRGGHHRQPVGQDRAKRGARGYDAGKKIKGRKRHLVVDTLGMVLAVVVHAANIQDRDGAKLVLAKLLGLFPRMKLIWADGGYAGKLIDWTRKLGHWVLQIVKRSDKVTGFVVLPKRWIVERTFAWLGRYRRLSKDYETLTESSESVIYLAMTHLMLRRLQPCVA